MGRIKKLMLLALVALSFWGAIKQVNAAEDFEIEQIHANMPDVSIYLRSEEQPNPDDLEITLGKEALAVQNIMAYEKTGMATDYFVLVDVSNSIPTEYCESIKSALNSFSTSLGTNDKMVLLSFGEEVNTLLSGTESAEERKNAIEQLSNVDKKTLLFEAIFQTADLADRMQDDNRKIVLVISDGEDFAVGTSTKEEAVAALNDRNMPVYAMGISDTDKENLNKFGETARTLGGSLTIFTAEETQQAVEELQNIWKSTWVISARAENNIIDNQKNSLLIKQVKSGVTRSKDVLLTTYQKDTEAPKIASVEKSGDRQLTVVFTKKVTGADNSTSWEVEYDGKAVPVTTVVLKEDGLTAVLTFENDFYTGTYNVAAPGVTDLSMEKNKVQNTVSVEIEGVEPEKEPSELERLWKEWWWVLPVAAVLILVIVILCVWRKIKKNKGIVYVDGKASLVNNVEEKQRIAIERQKGFPITLEFVGGAANGQKKIDAVINGSLIVGRSSICELSIEDAKMSRQHFALEYKDGDIFITDLNTTNGTAVNGVAVKRKTKLSPRDVITAGSLQMRINW